MLDMSEFVFLKSVHVLLPELLCVTWAPLEFLGFEFLFVFFEIRVDLVILIEGVDNLQDLVFEVAGFEIFSGLDFQEGDGFVIDHERDALRVDNEISEDFEQESGHLLASRFLDQRSDEWEEQGLGLDIVWPDRVFR